MLVENQPRPNSPTPDTDPTNDEHPQVLKSRTLPFLEHTDFFREAFESGPDATFLTYNPSAAFINPPHQYRAVRVDYGDKTKTVLFKYTNDGLKPHPERTFGLEDPFASNIDEEIVFGGVQVDKSRDSQGQIVSNWRTILYRGKTIPELRPFFTGPEGMKDIRPVRRPDGKMGVYTRPRNIEDESRGGEGQIGYREFDSLDQLEAADSASLDIENAPLLSFRFPKGEWGGVNHVQVIKDGKYKDWNLLLIHRARKDNVRHYSVGMLIHDPETGRVVDLGTFLKRSDLPPGPWKGQEVGDHDLEDVLFPAELVLEKDRVRIIAGTGDAEVVEVEIPIPLELGLAA